MENIFLFTMTDHNGFLGNWTKQAIGLLEKTAVQLAMGGLRTNSSKVIQV